jgi:non-ribosomal peptide synthetase component F
VECLDIRREDRIFGTAPFHFDMSTFDIYAALKAGASLCIAPDQYLLFPGKLLNMMEMQGATIWKSVSSLLAYISTTGCLKNNRIPTVGKILFAGEPLPAKHLIRWMEVFPEKKFYNAYGPTEATGISACYQIEKPPDDACETIPIGKPCANTEILLLAEDGNPVGAGEIGELCIRGSGVSPGYWNDESKTETSFVRNRKGISQSDRIYRTGDLGRLRPDGNYEYHGRKDFQVKYMGYRIELYEIEKALLSIDDIQHAAVLLCDNSSSDMKELVAFVETRARLDSIEIINGLKRLLPAYMLPKQVMKMKKLPLNDRGKTDREALRTYYGASQSDHQANRI